MWDSPPRVPFPLLGNLTFLPFSSYNALKEINHCLEIQKPGRAAVYSHFCFLHAQHKPTLRQGRGSEGKAPFLREQERKTYHRKKTQINISTKHPNMYLTRYSRSSKSFTQMNGLLKWVPWHFTSERLQDSAWVWNVMNLRKSWVWGCCSWNHPLGKETWLLGHSSESSLRNKHLGRHFPAPTPALQKNVTNHSG